MLRTGSTVDACRAFAAAASTRLWHFVRGLLREGARVLIAAMLFAICLSRAAAPQAAEISLPAADSSQPIVVEAQRAARWKQGDEEVWLLSGDCRVRQAGTSARAEQAVVWIDRGPGALGASRNKLTAYLEGGVEVLSSRGSAVDRMEDRAWLGRFYSTPGIEVRTPEPDSKPAERPAVLSRALAMRHRQPAGAVHRTEVQNFAEPLPPPEAQAPGRRLRAFPRSNVLPTIASYRSEATNEWITVIDRGVTLIIDGVDELGQIDISTDRMVIWKGGESPIDLSGGGDGSRAPLEIYMEGNIDFRQGDRLIRAQRMYYDVNAKIGSVLGAELLSPVPQFQGLVRLKADVVRQLGPSQFLAQNAFVTTSRLGQPGYRLQSSQIYFEDNQRPLVDPTNGAPLTDPLGDPLIDHQRLVTSRSNVLYARQVPFFYWPTFSTDLEDPNLFFRRVKVRNDNIFGTQILTDWDGYQLFGIRNPPAGTDLNLSLDYYSQRGPAGGPTFTYNRPDVFGIGGPAYGLFDAWFIRDTGSDTLGLGRRNVPPERLYRDRILARHRQQFDGGYQLTGELGWISDRNFLEQFFEREWDQFKDQNTGLELKRLTDNRSWSITADKRLNEFFTETEGVRKNHFWIGQPLPLGLNWTEHTQAGLARLRVASFPNNGVDAGNFTLLPWEVTSSGERLVTRHALDLPLALGPAKLVPYVIGEYGHWGNDLTGGDVDRLFGQAGLRASIPMWRVNPTAESALFNVHGLAHKLIWHADLSYADANRDLTRFPLYDNPDDNNIEHFRRRFALNTFGGAIPTRFDERFYALRSGLQNWVTSPTAEIADDMAAFRFGLNQRWQTKRGLPDRRRIIDWMNLNTSAVYFPRPGRDNFGEPFGLANYDFRWHVGDRVTVLSTGAFDFFIAGNQMITLGGFLNRPPRGSLFLGFFYLEGPITSRVVNASYTYRMSPKWVSTLGTSVDVSGNGNIGQFGSITRIGESLLFSLGFNVDASKGNVGANIAIEPRFLPSTRLGRVGGAQIPPAGVAGLE